MSSTSGQTWARQLRLAWNGLTGGRITRSFAALLIDKMIDWGTAAITKRFPVQLDGTPGEDAALALLASERGIVLDPGSTTVVQADRLQRWKTLWRFAGTPLGMLSALYIAGFPGAILVQQNGLSWKITGTPSFDLLVGLVGLPSWITRTVLPNANPSIPASTDGRPAIAANTVPWWTFDAGMDGAGNQYTSRFGILFDVSGGGTDPLAAAADLARIRKVIDLWRPAKAKCMGFRVITAGLAYGVGAHYATGTYGGTTTFYAAA